MSKFALSFLVMFLLSLLIGAPPMVEANEATSLTLSTDGSTEYQIVLPRTPTPVEQTAAEQLKQYLETVTGALWPLISEEEADDNAPQLVVGLSSRAEELVPGLEDRKFAYDEIMIEPAGKSLVFAGHPQRGTLYAVYTFLEDFVGVRWWTSTESDVPSRPTLKMTAPHVHYAPDLIYREAYYRDAFQGVFASRMKCNGNRENIPPEFGGHHRFVYFVHSFYRLIPPEKYFDDHPEWFSMIDGERKTERAQLCLTNDAMREELTENALAALRENPEARFISISQNDWHGQCQCEQCRAIEEKEGSPAGPLLHFVNRVAEEIEKEFPNVWVETLAYQYTRKPPKHVRPRENVVIRLCSIECSFAQPLATGPQNEEFKKDIEGWNEVADHLFIWDYVTNFHSYMSPHPNYHVLEPNIRFFVDHGTIGLFEQGDSTCSAGDFVRMRNWVISHLMWNPKLDERKLRKEFMRGYYGPAAEPLLEHLELMSETAKKSDVYLRCFMPDTSGWLDLATLNRSTRRFEEAEKAVADDPVRLARVQRAKMTIDHVWLKRYDRLKRLSQLKRIPFQGPEDPSQAVVEFFEKADRFDVQSYREHTSRFPFSEYRQSMLRRYHNRKVPEVPEPASDLADFDWLDYQQYEFNLARAGEWAELTEDPNASDGWAARMPGDHREWAVSCPLGSEIQEFSRKWHCWAAVRVEASAKKGIGMTLGIYDRGERQGVVSKRLEIDSLDGDQYRLIDLGVHPLDGEMYFWAAPPERAGDVEAVYVDRFFLTAED